MQHLSSRAAAFAAMHRQQATFIMPCAWDAFSAMLFEQSGFTCMGTTSGGANWVRGRQDYVYSTPREDMLDSYGEVAHATSLPVSGDLENGYGESPEAVADTIRGAIKAGMVGGSIEDQQSVPTDEACSNGSLFDHAVSVERIRAARNAADDAGIEFTLTARCEVYYTDDKKPYNTAVERLNSYREAGADCLFVPGLNNLAQLEQLVRDVDGPISFGMGATPEPLSVSMLEDIGIRRISTGGGLARASFTLLKSAAETMVSNGTFEYLDGIMSEADVNRVLNTLGSTSQDS